jgi:branched-chain amino acid transport system permease protein
MDFAFFAQLSVNGVLAGATYAMAALGLALLFGILHRINFAYGALYMVAAYVVWVLQAQHGLPYPVAVVLALGVMALVGIAFSELAFQSMQNRPTEHVILATLSLAIVAESAVLLWAGATPREITTPLAGESIIAGGIVLPAQRLVVLLAAGLAIGGLVAFLRFTSLGSAMRAVAQSREASNMVGIDVRRITRVATVISTLLVTLAASTTAPLYDLYPNMGADIVLKSFAVVIMGGMGNIAGAVYCGIALGLAESFAGALIGGGARDAISFVLMLLILLLKPNGLFGTTTRI